MYQDPMEVKVSKSWKKLLAEEFDKPYFHKLVSFVKDEYNNFDVYPKGDDIFKAFDACSFEDLKVVIIGQDPYHGEGQANGLCFSVAPNVKIPPSLRNIYKELNSDIGKEIPTEGDLSDWAKQGVLLLNATLTVRAQSPGSHQKKGWEQFTDAVINKVASEKQGLVFMLWGSYAQNKGGVIDSKKHHVLASAHPSPFSAYRGFLGNKHFSLCNQYLSENGKPEIVW